MNHLLSKTPILSLFVCMYVWERAFAAGARRPSYCYFLLLLLSVELVGVGATKLFEAFYEAYET